MEITGRTVLLTGASGGLGTAMARELAAAGARLVLSARNEPVLRDLARRTGGEVLVADLTDRADVERLVERSRDVDAVVLNAGIGGDTVLDDVTPEMIDVAIDTNLRAPMRIAVDFAQHHVAEDRPGAIVLIGSLSGLAPTPNTRLYNATKFGLRGFSLSLRQDLEGTPVSVTHVMPAFIRDAGMFAENDIDLPPGVRTKSPGDVAAAVVRALRNGPAEVFVSPVELRAASTFSTVAPAISAAILRRVGAAERTAQRTG